MGALIVPALLFGIAAIIGGGSILITLLIQWVYSRWDRARIRVIAGAVLVTLGCLSIYGGIVLLNYYRAQQITN